MPGAGNEKTSNGAGWFRFREKEDLLGFLNSLPFSDKGIPEIKKSGVHYWKGFWCWRQPEKVLMPEAFFYLAPLFGETGFSVEGMPPASFSVEYLFRKAAPKRSRGGDFAEEPLNAWLYTTMHEVFMKMAKTIPKAVSLGDGFSGEERLRHIEEMVKTAAGGVSAKIFSQFLLLVPKENIQAELFYLVGLNIRHIQVCQVFLKSTPESEGAPKRPFWLVAFMGKKGLPPIPPRGSVLYYYIGGDRGREVYLEMGWRYPQGWWRWLSTPGRGLRLVSGSGDMNIGDFYMDLTTADFHPVSSCMEPYSDKALKVSCLKAVEPGRVACDPACRISIPLELYPLNKIDTTGSIRLSRLAQCLSQEIHTLEHRIQTRSLELKRLSDRLTMRKDELLLLKSQHEASLALNGAIIGSETQMADVPTITLYNEYSPDLKKLVRDCSKRFLETTGYCFIEGWSAKKERKGWHLLAQGWLVFGGSGAQASGGRNIRMAADMRYDYTARLPGGLTFYADPHWSEAGVWVFAPENFAISPPFVFGSKNVAETREKLGALVCDPSMLKLTSAWKRDDWKAFIEAHLFVLMKPETDGGSPSCGIEVLRIRRDAISPMSSGLLWRGNARSAYPAACRHCGEEL